MENYSEIISLRWVKSVAQHAKIKHFVFVKVNLSHLYLLFRVGGKHDLSDNQLFNQYGQVDLCFKADCTDAVPITSTS